MSLGEIQQIYDLLVKIDELLGNVEAKTQVLDAKLPRTREALMTFRELERVGLRYLALARRFGLPEDMNNALQLLTRVLIIMRMLEISGAMLFSGTPIGLLLGVAGIAMATFSTVDVMAGY